ncbi:MAG: hypothetical protein OXU23_07490, partial [Candidatus Poribacteria bacterium]|nr:hypothetical protein [Candidatus Poribacteria bacterium]
MEPGFQCLGRIIDIRDLDSGLNFRWQDSMMIKNIIDSIFSFFNWRIGIGERWSHILTYTTRGLACILAITAIVYFT